jgi:6-pyruvoyltetrahydropterin/6-carboxytetrahydropterin synthase
MDIATALLLLFSLFATTAFGGSPAFRLGIRDSFMVAHSFHGHPAFGPAGGMHGATYTCDVEFASDYLHEECNWVIDIGEATEILALVLKKYNYQNLDEVFPNGEMTTTEFLCRLIHGELVRELKEKCKDFQGEVCVKLWESHKAWASYSGTV